MTQTKTRFDSALWIWDYFYIANVPAPGDEKPWGVIERATCRIHESEAKLDPSNASDVRLRSARRVRNSARTALRHIEQLSVQPERWVINALTELEADTGDLIEALSPPARDVVVH